jgi:hypothetical protein
VADAGLVRAKTEAELQTITNVLHRLDDADRRALQAPLSSARVAPHSARASAAEPILEGALAEPAP